MKSAQRKWLYAAATMLAAGGLGACNDSNSGSAAPPPGYAAQNFSSFTATTFEQPANSTPVNFDNVNLTYDVDNDPTAFNALLMM